MTGREKNNPFPPVRKIPRKVKTYRGYFNSVAMGSQLIHESRSVEKKLYAYLDFLFILGIVKSIYPQPVEIEYRPKRFYRPDVLVEFRLPWLKPWLIEAKGSYFNKARLQEFKPKLRGAIRYARKNGYVFHIVTLAQLNLVDNNILAFLETHYGRDVPLPVQSAVLVALKEHGPMHPRDLSRACSDNFGMEVAVEQIWRLAAAGKIFCDLTKSPSATVVAHPVSLEIDNLGKKSLFSLPFCLLKTDHD